MTFRSTHHSPVAVILATLVCSLPTPLLAGLPPASGPTSFASDDAFLECVQRQTFNFFWNEVGTNSGLIRDRSDGSLNCSIASIGFGLSAINVAADRGWISRAQARARALAILATLANAPQGPEISGVAGYRGWFYHFINLNTGLRNGSTELSPIDTTLLMMGVIDAGLYFDDPANADEALIRQLSDVLVSRLDWPFMTRTNDYAIPMQWTPEAGYSPGAWVGYSEASCMYLLGLGAATNPLPTASWQAWTKGYTWTTAYGFSFVSCAPLFTHQYSQTWIDFRFIADAYFRARNSDYFENSRRATLAQRNYAILNPLRFPNYGMNEWGLTACDGPNKIAGGVTYLGYSARGVPGGLDDGTIAPTAAISSLPFAPEVCLPAARHLYDAYLTNLWTSEGFRDAYNIQAGWWDGDTIGIDEGPILLMIENYRSGSVWRRMMRSPILQRGLARAGFTAPPPEKVTAVATATNQIQVSWSGPPSYHSGFQLLTSLDGVHYSLAASVGSNDFTASLPALPSTTYFVRVISSNAAGLSQPRRTVSVITPAVNPLSLPPVILTNSDASGSSSFDQPGHWSNAAAPDPGSDYFVVGAPGSNGFCLRTPAAPSNRTFAGNSLTLGDGLSHTSPNALVLAGAEATVLDLRCNAGSIVHDSLGARLTSGGVLSVLDGGVHFEQGAFRDHHLRVAATLRGGGPVTVSQSANGPVLPVPECAGCVEFTAPNTYLGPTLVVGTSLLGDAVSQTGPATLRVSDLQNAGVPSNLGQSSSLAANLLLDAGVLEYCGPGSTSDRLLTLGLLGACLDASGTGPLNLTNPGPLAFRGGGPRTLVLAGTNVDNNTLAAAIGDGYGPTTVLKTNSGTWALAGTNLYTGQTHIAGGTLIVSGNSALGSTQTVVLNSGTLLLSNALVSSPILVNNGNLRFSGPQVTNSLRGPITIASATLNIRGQTGVGAGGATLLVAGGLTGTNRDLEIADGLSGDAGRVWIVGKPINLGAGELRGFGAHLAVAGNLVGTVHPCGGGRITLETNNAFSGSPALYLGNPSWGRLDLNGRSLIVSCLTNSLALDEVTSSSTAALMVANSVSNFYSGSLTGPGLALTKTAGGTLTLSGSNSFAGPTTLISGTLALCAPPGPILLLPNSRSITVGNGTLFDVSAVSSGFCLARGQILKGSGAVKGQLTVGPGATLGPGDPAVAAIKSLEFSNNLVLEAGSTTVVHVAKSPLTNDLLRVVGDLCLDGTLVVKNISSTPLAAGDSFRFFLAGGSSNGRFTAIVPEIPGPGLVWDTSRLTSSGTVGVALNLRFDSVEVQGTNLVLAGSGGGSNAPFYVLFSTDVGLPLALWRQTVSNHFDSNGDFWVSTPLPTTQALGFFRLQLP